MADQEQINLDRTDENEEETTEIEGNNQDKNDETVEIIVEQGSAIDNQNKKPIVEEKEEILLAVKETSPEDEKPNVQEPEKTLLKKEKSFIVEEEPCMVCLKKDPDFTEHITVHETPAGEITFTLLSDETTDTNAIAPSTTEFETDISDLPKDQLQQEEEDQFVVDVQNFGDKEFNEVSEREEVTVDRIQEIEPSDVVEVVAITEETKSELLGEQLKSETFDDVSISIQDNEQSIIQDENMERIAAEEAEKERVAAEEAEKERIAACLLYTSPSPRDGLLSRMPSSA